MLTDKQIDKYLYKFTQRQDRLNVSLKEIILKRIRSIGNLPYINALYSPEGSSKSKNDTDEITRIVTTYKKEQQNQLDDVLWEIALLIYMESMGAKLSMQSFKNTKEISQLVSTYVLFARNDLGNMINTPIYSVPSNISDGIPKLFTPRDLYTSVINKCATFLAFPKSDFLQHVRPITRHITKPNIAYIDKEDNVHPSNSLRMNVLNHIKGVINQVDNFIESKFGGDCVELSAHLYPAPDHAPAQGHIFLKTEFAKMQNGENFTDVNGTTYIGFERKIGEWNCRHYVKTVKRDKKPDYTDKQLKDILSANERGYTTKSGRHLTLYECSQLQNEYARRIRSAKQKYLFAQFLGDQDTMRNMRTNVSSLTNEYNVLSRACNLPMEKERLVVEGFK